MGGLIAVEITHQNRKNLIVNIYAPNGAKNTFFQELQEHMTKTSHEHIITMRDFNGTVYNNIDRSVTNKKSKTKNGKLPESFFRLVENEGLIDVWRKRNQGKRDYTFYSNRNKVWSRIDMVWISKELELLTNEVDILPRMLSDHSPIIWKMKDMQEMHKIWRINEDLLDRHEIVDQIKVEIKNYFEINTTPQMKSSTMWDAFKVVIRGKLINLNTMVRKKKNEEISQLQKDLEKTESELKRKPGKKKLEKQRRLLKQQIDNFETQEMIWALKKAQ